VIGWRAASRIAGRAETWLRRRKESGELQATKNESGENVFARAELEALRPPPPPDPATADAPGTVADTSTATGSPASATVSTAISNMTPGEREAAVFTELDEGLTPTAIVRKLEITFKELQPIIETWKTAKLADVSSPSVPAEIQRFAGKVASVEKRFGELHGSVAETTGAWVEWQKGVDDWRAKHEKAEGALQQRVEGAIAPVQQAPAQPEPDFVRRKEFEEWRQGLIDMIVDEAILVRQIFAGFAAWFGLRWTPPPFLAGRGAGPRAVR
jgi:hypothetical protein